MKTRSRPAGVLPFLALLLLGLSPPPPAQAAPALLEELHFRMEVLSLQNAARVKLTLNRLGPGRYTAEIIGETLGLIKLLTGGQRERLQTEMVWRDQRLLPLIYREESWRRGKRRLKEYIADRPCDTLCGLITTARCIEVDTVVAPRGVSLSAAETRLKQSRVDIARTQNKSKFSGVVP